MSAIATPQRQNAAESNEDSGIMSSIAALRQVLMIDTPTKSLLSEKNTSIAVQQSRYEERRKYEDQIGKLESSIADLQTKLSQVQQESEKEKSVSKTLETTYEALSQHKKELTVQLQLVSKSRESLEEKLANVSKMLEAEKASFAKERQEWRPKLAELNEEIQASLKATGELEARYMASLREAGELKGEVVSLKTQMEASEAQKQETAQSHISVKDNLKQRLEDTEAARNKSEEELQKVKAELESTKQELSKKQQQETDGEKEVASSSIASVDDFLQEITEKYKTAETMSNSIDSLVNDVGKMMKGLKCDISKLEEDKVQLESQLKSNKLGNDKSDVDLATSREKWRTTKDELQEAKEELEEKRSLIAELEDKVKQMLSEKKRANEEVVKEGDEEGSLDAKRQKTEREKDVYDITI